MPEISWLEGLGGVPPVGKTQARNPPAKPEVGRDLLGQGGLGPAAGAFRRFFLGGTVREGVKKAEVISRLCISAQGVCELKGRSGISEFTKEEAT